MPCDSVPDSVLGPTLFHVGEQAFPAEVTRGWIGGGTLLVEISMSAEAASVVRDYL